MKRLLVFSFVSLLACSLRAVEFQPKTLTEDLDDEGSSGAWRNAVKQPSETLIKEPAYSNGPPLYLSIPIGNDLDNIITGILDGTAKGAYDILRLDANNNNDLSDDAVVTLKPHAYSNMPPDEVWLESEPVQLTVKYFDGTERKIRGRIHLMGSRSKGNREFQYEAAEYVEGKVDLGSGKSLLMGLYDLPGDRRPANGCFNDIGIDHMRIDQNGDGKLDLSEEVPLNRVFQYDGKLWNLSVDSSASDVSVTPCNLAVGKIRFSSSFAEGAHLERGTMKIASKEGYVFICSLSAKDSLPVPEGDYSAASSELDVTDASGKKWTTKCSFPSKTRIEPGKETVLTLGAPIKVEPQISGTLKPGQKITVLSRQTGASGEVYDMFVGNGGCIIPSVKITDDKGKGTVISEGKMGLG